MVVIVLPTAEADLDAISGYIDALNPRAARTWLDEMEARIARLGEAPGAGAPRFETRPGLRILPMGRYVILYQHEGEDAVVVRVVHGARAWERLLP